MIFIFKFLKLLISIFSNLINWILTLGLLLMVGVYLVDRFFTDGFFLGKIIRFFLENGDLSSGFFNLGLYGVAGLALFCLGGYFLKARFKKRFQVQESGLVKTTLFYVSQVVLNGVVLASVLLLLIKISVLGYVNTIFEDQFYAQPSGSYLDKVDLIQEHLLDSKEAATLVLSRMMMDFQFNPQYLDHLNHEEYKALAYEVNELIKLKGGPMTREEHYFRNYFNRAPETLMEMIKTIQYGNHDFGWKLMPFEKALFHMNGVDGEYNLKYVSADGYFEAVYNKDGDLLTAKNDPINMGTYNFADPMTDSAGHGLYDVTPYLYWGNTHHNKAPLEDLTEHLSEQYLNNPDAQARFQAIQQSLINGDLTQWANVEDAYIK